MPRFCLLSLVWALWVSLSETHLPIQFFQGGISTSAAGIILVGRHFDTVKLVRGHALLIKLTEKPE